MSLQNLQTLPPEVKEVVFSTEITEYNRQIADKFSLNKNQLDFILDLQEKIFLQKISSLDLPTELEGMERASYYDLREISLEIALKILWPLQDYLKDVDRLILRLGGKVPHLKHLHKVAIQNPILPDFIKGSIKHLLSQYSDFKTLRLSSQKIIDHEGRRVTPSVDNWIENYIKDIGAGYHSSLQRAQYLAKNPNILELSPQERQSIRNFFISYDEDLPVEVNASDVILNIREAAPKKDQTDDETTKPDLAKLLPEIHDKILAWDKKIVSEELILSEAQNSLHKLRDILWQAVGIQDQDKTIGCLRVLINKKALDLMLQEDKRFQSILRRFIGVKYDSKISNFITPQTDKLLVRRLFLELVLNDKLRLSQEQATIVAYYLINLQAGSGQVVFLDLTDQTLKWRELQQANNQLTWADNI